MDKRPTYTSNIDICVLIFMNLLVGLMIVPLAFVMGDTLLVIGAFVMIAMLIVLIIWLIRNINAQKVAKGYRQKFLEYLRLHDYTEIYGERLRYSLPIRGEQKTQLVFKVYDPQPRTLTYTKVTSPIPERYDFYQPVDNDSYLCVYDSYISNIYLLKQNLP